MINRERLIRIFPTIEFVAQCPHDGANLNMLKPIIPGMRCLVECACPACGNGYYADLPVGQALWSPMIINRKSGEIYDPFRQLAERGAAVWFFEWFRQPLQNSFLHPDSRKIVPTVQIFHRSERIVVLNCLDFLYGHSLLKLLNAQRYLDHTPELGCCVLVPTQLRHLVPDGVAEIWEVPLAINEGWGWYPSLQTWIAHKITQYRECFLSPAYSHPSHHVYDLSRFVKNLPDVSERLIGRQPVIMYCYREDRLWGRTPAQQDRNIRALYRQLTRIFPNLLFVLTGFGQRNISLPPSAGVLDLRTPRFDLERDLLWLAYMTHADCAVGIHGSNMLLPSGLAKSTVELVPRSRLGNSVQDFLFPPSLQAPRDALLYYRMLYGNETLSNIHPSMVADLVANAISYSPMNAQWFQCGEQDAFEFAAWPAICEHPVFKQAATHLGSQPNLSWSGAMRAYLAEFFFREKGE
ncbi:hypothetical protein U14_01807 [Candidatus Moduliflexus flocculans]|uniref:Uncharacterized protein n=1 Tax=Candidatus Moduliflexus flocculans TaxID=1499966 RepID=A0A0S6VX48_9BACT|nr:hypothetical protein U14_01807 [Candidatus Moduliflexus flocculans]